MSCGCTDPCQPNSIPCTCEARVTSDCVTVSGATSNCLAIDDNLLLTDYLTQMDERICEKVDSVTNFIALENVGTGSQLYKGDSLLGKKQIRTVKSLDPNLVVTQTDDEIQLDLNIPAIVPPDGTETKLVSGTNTTVAGNGSIATPYSVNVAFPTPSDGSETKINAGTNVTVTGNGTDATPYIINSSGGATVNDATSSIKGILRLTGDLGGTADAPTTPTAVHKTGNETFTGNKSGSNTSATPTRLLINTSSDATFEGFLANTASSTQPAIRIKSSTVTVEGGGIASIIETFGHNAIGLKIEPQQNNPTSGNMLVLSNKRALNNFIDIATPLSILRDGVEVAKISDIGDHTANKYRKTGGTSTQMLMADGSVKENQDNLQKVITTSTTISNSDNNYIIFINNGATPITITIDSSITLPNFGVGFIQEGTGDVTFVGTGVSLTNPVGLKSKGQGYTTFIERKLATSNYFLLGNVKS